MVIDLDKYRAGQIITSMTRRVFIELWDEIKSGEASNRWSEGKESETRKECTEELRIRTMCVIFQDHRNTFQWLLDEDWGLMEVYMDKNNEVAFRVMESSSQKLAKAKALHRQYYGK